MEISWAVTEAQRRVCLPGCRAWQRQRKNQGRPWLGNRAGGAATAHQKQDKYERQHPERPEILSSHCCLCSVSPLLLSLPVKGPLSRWTQKKATGAWTLDCSAAVITWRVQPNYPSSEGFCAESCPLLLNPETHPYVRPKLSATFFCNATNSF